MATQHPDAASKYVSIQQEPDEAIKALTPAPDGGGFDEIMIDFEGKLTPYQQTSQIVLGLLAKGIVPGKDVRVTPRIPSGREEGIFRQLMSLMSIVESNYNSVKEASVQGISEVVLPMTTQAAELIALKGRIIDVIELAHKEFGLSKDPASLNIIPLFESIPPVLNCGRILADYREGLKKINANVKQIRVMLGFSDLALSYGMPATALFVKYALSQLSEVSHKYQIEVLPILGGGTLPFRGFVTHENQSFFADYPGVKTITAQSAIRYDYPPEETDRFVSFVKEMTGRNLELKRFSGKENKSILNFAGCFSLAYLSAFSSLAELAVNIADLVPSQRDRLARKSEVGYARDVAHPEELARFIPDKNLGLQLKNLKLKSRSLPRAISFTAALYSIGLPPEIIGTGKGLKMIKARYGNSAIAELLNYYPGLKGALEYSGRFLALDMAEQFLSKDAYLKVKADVRAIEDLLEIKLQPLSKEDGFYHTVIETMKPMLKQLIGKEELVSDEGIEAGLVKEWLIKLGTIRKALG